MQVLETAACFVFHHANAFEEASDVPGDPPHIKVDSICYDCLPVINPRTDYVDIDFDTLSPGQLWRSTLDLKNQTIQRQRLDDRCVEFPTLNPRVAGRQARYVYLAAAHHPQGNAPLQGILKLDLNTGEQKFHSFAPRSFANEPVFVPHPQGIAEDEGWILVLTYNGERHCGDLVILNAQSLEPEATLHLQHHIPYGLHGSFVPQIFTAPGVNSVGV
jgi:all-trans-8'-apo-beta-carotenal 15,15'-oxygenase